MSLRLATHLPLRRPEFQVYTVSTWEPQHGHHEHVGDALYHGPELVAVLLALAVGWRVRRIGPLMRRILSGHVRRGHLVARPRSP